SAGGGGRGTGSQAVRGPSGPPHGPWNLSTGRGILTVSRTWSHGVNAAGNAARLAQLFRDAGTAHHRAFAATNGEDAEWPAWYAAYLAPRFGAMVGVMLSADRLAADLVIVDRVYRDAGSALTWSEYYVEWFLQKYGRA